MLQLIFNLLAFLKASHHLENSNSRNNFKKDDELIELVSYKIGFSETLYNRPFMFKSNTTLLMTEFDNMFNSLRNSTHMTINMQKNLLRCLYHRILPFFEIYDFKLGSYRIMYSVTHNILLYDELCNNSCDQLELHLSQYSFDIDSFLRITNNENCLTNDLFNNLIYNSEKAIRNIPEQMPIYIMNQQGDLDYKNDANTPSNLELQNSYLYKRVKSLSEKLESEDHDIKTYKSILQANMPCQNNNIDNLNEIQDSLRESYDTDKNLCQIDCNKATLKTENDISEDKTSSCNLLSKNKNHGPTPENSPKDTESTSIDDLEDHTIDKNIAIDQLSSKIEEPSKAAPSLSNSNKKLNLGESSSNLIRNLSGNKLVLPYKYGFKYFSDRDKNNFQSSLKPYNKYATDKHYSENMSHSKGSYHKQNYTNSKNTKNDYEGVKAATVYQSTSQIIDLPQKDTTSHRSKSTNPRYFDKKDPKVAKNNNSEKKGNVFSFLPIYQEICEATEEDSNGLSGNSSSQENKLDLRRNNENSISDKDERKTDLNSELEKLDCDDIHSDIDTNDEIKSENEGSKETHKLNVSEKLKPKKKKSGKKRKGSNKKSHNGDEDSLSDDALLEKQIRENELTKTARKELNKTILSIVSNFKKSNSGPSNLSDSNKENDTASVLKVSDDNDTDITDDISKDTCCEMQDELVGFEKENSVIRNLDSTSCLLRTKILFTNSHKNSNANSTENELKTAGTLKNTEFNQEIEHIYNQYVDSEFINDFIDIEKIAKLYFVSKFEQNIESESVKAYFDKIVPLCVKNINLDKTNNKFHSCSSSEIFKLDDSLHNMSANDESDEDRFKKNLISIYEFISSHLKRNNMLLGCCINFNNQNDNQILEKYYNLYYIQFLTPLFCCYGVDLTDTGSNWFRKYKKRMIDLTTILFGVIKCNNILFSLASNHSDKFLINMIEMQVLKNYSIDMLIKDCSNLSLHKNCIKCSSDQLFTSSESSKICQTCRISIINYIKKQILNAVVESKVCFFKCFKYILNDVFAIKESCLSSEPNKSAFTDGLDHIFDSKITALNLLFPAQAVTPYQFCQKKHQKFNNQRILNIFRVSFSIANNKFETSHCDSLAKTATSKLLSDLFIEFASHSIHLNLYCECLMRLICLRILHCKYPDAIDSKDISIYLVKYLGSYVKSIVLFLTDKNFSSSITIQNTSYYLSDKEKIEKLLDFEIYFMIKAVFRRNFVHLKNHEPSEDLAKAVESNYESIKKHILLKH